MSKKLSKICAFLLISVFFCSCASKINAIQKTTGSADGILKIMTYNIHHANPPSKTGLIDIDAIAEVIKKENPDLVGLQEVDRFTKRSGNIDEAKLLAEKTGLHYQFFKAIDYDGGDYGVAILSRFPINNGMQITLPQVTKVEERILAYVNVTLPNNTLVTFANTHLDATGKDNNRVVQMKALLSALDSKNGTTIVVGDLNCESTAEPIVLLDQKFLRSCVNNCKPTIPQDAPLKTIDYIALKNASWIVKEHRVIPEVYASDHRPVVVVYQIK